MQVPIYAVDSWFSLRFKEARFYIDPVRECYEAFVIYNFYMYLVAYLEDEFGDIEVGHRVCMHVCDCWGGGAHVTRPPASQSTLPLRLL